MGLVCHFGVLFSPFQKDNLAIAKYSLSLLFFLLVSQMLNPKMKIKSSEELISVVRLLIIEDQCNGRFTFGRQEVIPKKSKPLISKSSEGGDVNVKGLLQTLLARAGHDVPRYRTKELRNNHFKAAVEFNGMQFVGQSCSNKKLAEKDAAKEALEWLNCGSSSDLRLKDAK